MGDQLKRFRRLERARQDADPADPRASVAGPVSGRFAAIEPRGPRPAPADPFTPPAEDARELLIAHEAPPLVREAQELKRARARAALEDAAAALEDARAVRDGRQQARGADRVILATLHAVAELGTPVRVLLIAALIVVALIAGDVVGPVAWVLGALPVAVIGASLFVGVPERP